MGKSPGRVVAESRGGVGVERAVAGGEGGDGGGDAGVGGGWPCGVANVLPERIVVAQREKLNGNAASDGQSAAVEPVDDMRSDNFRMDGGDTRVSVLIGGGGNGRR